MQLKSAVGSSADGKEAGSAGPIVQLRLSVTRSPWRISPAWSVIAGAIAGGAAYLDGSVLLRLFASVLLAELAWGSLWRVGVKDPREGTTQAGSSFLPYSTPGAPVVRLSEALTYRAPDGTIRSGWHDLALGLVLTVALSLLLGRIALALSLAAMGVSLSAWLLASRGSAAALPHALLGVGLPWLLGAASESRDLADLAGLSPWILALATVYTVLQWGVLRAEAAGEERVGLLWCGQLLVVVASVGAGLPWLTILLAAVMLVPTLRLAPGQPVLADRPGGGRSASRAALAVEPSPSERPDRAQAGGGPPGVGAGERVRSCAVWWWAAMMISAFAWRLAALPSV